MILKINTLWTKLQDRAYNAFPGLANWFFFVFDHAGNILTVSPGLKKVLGYGENDMHYMNIFQLFDITAEQDMAEILKSLLAGQAILTFTGTGGTKIKMRVEVEKGKIGEHPVSLCLAFPVTEKENKYDESLISDRLLFEKAFEITNDGLCQWSKPNDTFTVNRQYYELLGFGHLEFKPSPDNLINSVHPEDRAKLTLDFDNLWKGKIPFMHEEVRMRHKSDEYIWVLVRSKIAEWNKANQPCSIIIVVSNITNVKNTEQALRESEEKFRRIADVPYEGTLIYDSKGIILDTNTEITKITGGSKKEIIGKQVLDLFPEEYHKAIVDQIIIKDYKPFEVKILNNNNEKIDVEILITKYFHEGKKASLVGIRPVSDRKKAEIELLEAKLKAEESDNLKTAFLSNMSHEIRTPINGIIGFLEILKNPSLSNEERNEYLDIINNRSLMLLKIIDDIIDLSKIQAHQVDVTEEECHIGKLMHELFKVFEKLKSQMEKSQIELKLNTPEEPHEKLIYTDPTRLQQVLTNLVNNALKFTHQGYIEFGYTLKSPDRLEFYVADTGIGIPEEQYNNVFERFRQLETGARKKYSGSGLGLSISKGIVELLGGEIKVESKLNRGTRFYFSIPYKTVEVKQENNSRESTEAEVNWKGKNILLVEDDDINRKFMQLMLKGTSANIISAVNGQQSVDICINNPEIDIVLMDLQLPVMNGYEAMEHIKKMRPDLPVIAQTGYAMNEEKNKCLEAGFDDYISKPISKTKLFPMIGRFLESEV